MTASKPFGSTFLLFCEEASKALVARGTFDAEWFNSQAGKLRMEQCFGEGLSFETAVSELELWCKGFVQNRMVALDEAPLARTRNIPTICLG
jgi:hypothetical protein